MGLDTVELVIAIEDEFGISIKDEDAARMATPGEVTDYIMTCVRINAADPCPSQVGFYRVRSVLTTLFSIPRQEIHPQTSLQDILESDIRKNWEKLRTALGVDHFPKLKRTKFFFSIVVIGIPAAIVSPMLKFGFSFSTVIIPFSIIAVLANALTANMGTMLPSRLQTVDALIPYIGCANSVLWTRELVLTRVIQVTAKVLGVQVDKISENSHFVYDLGAD